MNKEPANLFYQLHLLFKNQLDQNLRKFANSMSPLIVTGYQGLPVLEVAKYLAKIKLCQSSSRPCLKCICCESVDKETSVHIKLVKPEGRVIKVDQIREVIDFLSFKRDHVTIVIFDQAQLLNLQAANALLKTLEEPPQNCWILLTSPSIKNVLSTIRSRCVVYKSRPLQLHAFPDLGGDIQQRQELIQGRWDWLLKSEEIFESINDVKTWLLKLNQNNDFSVDENELVLLDWMKGREGLLELIVYLRLLAKIQIKDVLKGNSSGVEVLDGENTVYPDLDFVDWISLIDNLQKLESAVNSNVDTKLVEEHLFDALKESHVFH